MYHCVALEDLLDLLNFGCDGDAALRDDLEAAAKRMLQFAAAVQTPAGGTPLLGDAWEGGAPGPAELAAYAERLGLVGSAARGSGRGEIRLFPGAGILVWRDPRAYLIADVGGIGPPHLAGHGHCDSLAFECWIDGRPIIVDSGTYTYEPGELRHACRATRAHNTLELDGVEQHEIWEAFRVARRSSVRTVQLSDSAVESRLVPWHDKRLQVMRRFDFAAGALRVEDRVEGRGSHRITSRLHLHPECDLAFEGGRLVARHGQAAVEIVWREHAGGAGVGSVRLQRPGESESLYAARAGETRRNAVLVVEHTGPLPFASELSIRALGPG
jgi:heparinase II/III-like protein